jgi:HlyD family secretion protein
MQTKKRNRFRWWMLAAVLAVLFLGSRACKKDKAMLVAVTAAKKTRIVETVESNGKIYPVNETRISAEAGSLVEEIYVKEGDTVVKGQLLALVKTGQTTAVAGAAGQQPDLQKLIGQSGLNPAAIAQALKNSQPSAPVIKTRIQTLRITASMSGIISGVSVKKGERMMGTEVARISSARDWEIRADVGESDIVKIKEGNTVEVELDAIPGKKLTGVLYRIASGGVGMSSSMPGNLYADITTYKVYITVSHASVAALNDSITGAQYTLRAGMNASVSIQTRARENTLYVPLKAVTTRFPSDSAAGNENKEEEFVPGAKKAEVETVVFTVVKGQVVKRKVTTGIQDMNHIEILSGIQEGEEVISDPFELVDKTLENGMRVKVVSRQQLYKK